MEAIQDISRNKDGLTVQTTLVMAAVWHSMQAVTSGVCDRGIYLKKIVTGCKLHGEDVQNNLITVCLSSVLAGRFLGHLLTVSVRSSMY